MKRNLVILIVLAFCSLAVKQELQFKASAMTQPKLKFNVRFPETASKEPLDGRLLLLISTNNEKEPRFQINEDLNTQQVFGIDVDGWKAKQIKVVDGNAFGYPRRTLTEIPTGEYWIGVKGNNGTALPEISTANPSKYELILGRVLTSRWIRLFHRLNHPKIRST
jgi:hypothetical protein